jgi:hypothetical protein
LQKAQREAWFNLVEKELGITVKEDTTSGLADIRFATLEQDLNYASNEAGILDVKKSPIPD